MTIDKRLILPVALVAGAAVTAILASRVGHNRRHEKKRQQQTEKAELQAWEGEGGTPGPPAGGSRSS